MKVKSLETLFFIIILIFLSNQIFTLNCMAAFVADVTNVKNNQPGTKDWSQMKLWYRQPAKRWVEALPVGNGRLGAMVFGKTEEERIQLNEETIWTGGPYDPSRPGGPEALPEIRRLVFQGNYLKAHKLFGRTMMGIPNEQMKYQPLADLWLTFPGHKQVSEYRRQLDLDKAIVQVTYNINDVKFTREIFSSAVDQVIVIHLSASKPGKISFRAYLTGYRNTSHSNYGNAFFRMEADPPDNLVLWGKTSCYLGIEGRVKYRVQIKACLNKGEISLKDETLIVKNADAVTLLIAAASNFVSYKDLSGNPEMRVKKYLERVARKSYDQIRREHVAEYRQFFRRVWLDLGTSEAVNLPTDQRLRKFSEDNDPQLVALFFQFGRYLLISSSRPGTQPANLQGIWNEDMNPAWDSKYTTNINLEMNYWPAEVTNLSECHEPLLRMISELVNPGSRVAKLHYGARGWVLHQNTDLWRASAPMDGPSWGTFSTGGAWLSTHLWEHYLFSGDEKFLKDVYPIMKGSARFFLDTLVEHPRYRWLVTCPATSPENVPKVERQARFMDESSGLFLTGTTICAGPTIDMEILRYLFDSCIKASEILGVDKKFREELRETRKRLAPLQIGKYGQLQEWLDDWDDPQDTHRHLSHLWGLYPGNLITPQKTPDLAQAAKKSLIFRGDGGPGFSMAWKVNLWARLLDGEHAYKVLKRLLTENTYPNLFSKCFKALQVDGTFGGCAGIAEMLLQSHAGEIHLLPALPKAWPKGSIKGLRARGGFEVGMEWDEGKLSKATILSKLGKDCRVRVKVPVEVKVNGQLIEIRRPEENVIVFKTEANKVYELSIKE